MNLLCSDRLCQTKCSVTGSGSEASTPLAGTCPSNHSLNFQAVFTESSDIVRTASGHTVGSEEHVSFPNVDKNGVSVVKKAKISIPLSFDAQNGIAAPSAIADVKKVVPLAEDVLALAVQIKHDHAGCGVKKVLLEMLHRHPDWAITEHRLNKLLHENGLVNVKKSPQVTVNTDSIPHMFPQRQQSDHAVSDIHFDILSLPQSHAVPDELWQQPLSPSLNSALPPQSANAIVLDSFKPDSKESVSSSADGDLHVRVTPSTSSATAARECSNSIDLGKLFGTAAADAVNAEAPSVV